MVAYLALDIGEKGMNKGKNIYPKAPKRVSKVITKREIVVDFLPPPSELIKKEPKVKITITLNSESVEFFKKHAKQNNVKYQTMINEVLDRYVQRYKRAARS